MSKQVKLTVDQAQRFYKEYTLQKIKRMDVGGPADFIIWKNQIEMYLSEASTGNKWSNTEIRNANRRLVRSSTAPGEHIMSDKQAKLFSRYITGNEEIKEQFASTYNIDKSQASRYVREHPGLVYAFLTNYGETDWNQYFNS